MKKLMSLCAVMMASVTTLCASGHEDVFNDTSNTAQSQPIRHESNVQQNDLNRAGKQITLFVKDHGNYASVHVVHYTAFDESLAELQNAVNKEMNLTSNEYSLIAYWKELTNDNFMINKLICQDHIHLVRKTNK